MALWKRYFYRCNNNRCKAEDSDVLLIDGDAHSAPMPIIVCAKCGLGKNKTLPEQVASNSGMSLIPGKEPEVWESGGYSEAVEPVLGSGLVAEHLAEQVNEAERLPG